MTDQGGYEIEDDPKPNRASRVIQGVLQGVLRGVRLITPQIPRPRNRAPIPAIKAAVRSMGIRRAMRIRRMISSRRPFLLRPIRRSGS